MRSWGRQDGGRNLVCRTLALPESANRQRATTQMPQRLDATHGGELFPVKDGCAALAPGGILNLIATSALIPGLLIGAAAVLVPHMLPRDMLSGLGDDYGGPRRPRRRCPRGPERIPWRRRFPASPRSSTRPERE
jgi:hypothetical protein